jgi:hypothetical protein
VERSQLEDALLRGRLLELVPELVERDIRAGEAGDIEAKDQTVTALAPAELSDCLRENSV